MALAAAALVALAIATRAPLATTVIGLICFGILHNVLELRYVLGRFGWVLDGQVGLLLLTLITGICATRLGGAYLGTWSRPLEITLGYAVLAAGAYLGFQRAPAARYRTLEIGAIAAALVAALGLSLSFPAYHFVVLTHLHNLVPLAFLWEWSRRLVPRARRGFRAVQVGWVLAVPALILLGAVDRWVSSDAGAVGALVGDGSAVIAASAWPGAPDVGLRFLVVFAFLQTMHYVVWVWFLPRVAPEATRAFEGRWPRLTARRIWLVGLGVAVLLGVLLLSDYGQGRTVYAGLATYHAYLEFPVLLVLLVRGRVS
ncbi:MAG: hypothetical protein KBG77_15045 [Dermatophilaceae bacterium]|nr:hypothetical protein [Dermatophilaceae bacterium]